MTRAHLKLEFVSCLLGRWDRSCCHADEFLTQFVVRHNPE
jgi:hypothetical protein